MPSSSGKFPSIDVSEYFSSLNEKMSLLLQEVAVLRERIDSLPCRSGWACGSVEVGRSAKGSGVGNGVNWWLCKSLYFLALAAASVIMYFIGKLS